MVAGQVSAFLPLVQSSLRLFNTYFVYQALWCPVSVTLAIPTVKLVNTNLHLNYQQLTASCDGRRTERLHIYLALLKLFHFVPKPIKKCNLHSLLIYIAVISDATSRIDDNS